MNPINLSSRYGCTIGVLGVSLQRKTGKWHVAMQQITFHQLLLLLPSCCGDLKSERNVISQKQKKVV
jgi:hypothetical protein